MSVTGKIDGRKVVLENLAMMAEQGVDATPVTARTGRLRRGATA